jgi:hypothetical protein
MPLQGRLTVERMCQLAGVSRAGFYRHLVEIEPHAEEMELRDSIQRIYLEHRRHYGCRVNSLTCGGTKSQAGHPNVRLVEFKLEIRAQVGFSGSRLRHSARRPKGKS